MSCQEIDPMVVEEVVTIEGQEAKYERTDFAAVVFHNIAESYPEDAHVECRYTVTSDLVPTSRDWVGLYKVGWMSPKDYVYYEWAPIPSGYQVGCDCDASILFQTCNLPKDDGEFYQFCYISSSNQIRGASTPFQFRKPGSEDFVEIEDDDINMLVIRSKTLHLQEVLQKAEIEKNKFLEVQDVLQKERDSLVTKYQDAKTKLTAMEINNVTLKEKMTAGDAKLEELKHEARDMNVLREELQIKIEKLKNEKALLDARILDVTDHLMSAQSDIKRLQQEKDELSGKNAVLLEQMETYKQHFSTSENALAQYTQMSDNLQVKLTQQELLINDLKRTVDQLNLLLETTRSNLDKQMVVNTQDKEYAQDLEERLKNAEDKLSAAEESKGILQKEVSMFEEMITDLQKKVEKSKTECDSVKQKLQTLEDDFTQKTEIQKSEIEQMQSDLKSVIEEKEKLQMEKVGFLQNLSVTQDKSELLSGSMSIMQQSLQQIKDRLEKKEKQCKHMERALQSREHEFVMKENDLEKEVSELRDKILMCYEEYKTIYIEKSKLERKLDKTARKRKSKLQPVMTSEPAVELESQQTNPPSRGTSQEQDAGSLEIEQKINDLQMEFDKKLMTNEKYKKMYVQEEKIKELADSHGREMKEKVDEIERLKKKIELANDLELKIQALEKCVTEKELEIERLNEKLRMTNLERTEETGASILTSQKTKQYIRYPEMSPCSPMHIPAAPQNIICNPNWVPYQIGPTYAYPTPGLIQYPYPQGTGPQQHMAPPLPPRVPQQSYLLDTVGLCAPPLPPRRQPYCYMEDLEQDCAVECDKTCSVLDRPESQSEKLDQPLTPLPAPLEPEKLLSAKVAEVRYTASSELTDEKFVKNFGSDMANKGMLQDGQLFEVPRYIRRPESPIVMDMWEDRFYDAQDFCVRSCHICNKTFPPEIDEQLFMEHTSSHFAEIGTFCPICKHMKSDNMTDKDFELHVNMHCEEQEVDM